MERNEYVRPLDTPSERVETSPAESAEFIEIRLLDKIETIEKPGRGGARVPGAGVIRR
ncbi:hypothetical protein OG381_00925 [Streptomyces sp. NBC_00490]|uniref:hypothetical protein n=1 Tax=Streptomyces sp. NBC_00490 TaxID=2903657 RepID=UPI002E18DFCA